VDKTEDACTSEVGSVRERRGHLPLLRDDVHYALLYEVHLGAQRALPDDVVGRLVHLESELTHHLRHELRVGVREERHGRHQRPAIVIDQILNKKRNELFSNWGLAIVNKRKVVTNNRQL
jgi:hypothetical protein